MRQNKFIETDNIFIDASIFEEQNFLHSTKIHSLFYYGQIGAIKIHSTTISKMELDNRIEKRIILSKTAMNKLQREFNHKDIRVVKNLNFYDKIEIPKISINGHKRELTDKINALFSRSNVNTIYTRDIPIKELVNNYYKKKPPFHNSGKQNEFIDAFILKTLENWCKRHKTKMYVLSKDPDFLGYKSDYLIIEDDIALLLEKITKYYHQRYKLNKINSTEKIIENNKSDIENIASSLIKEKIFLRGENIDITDFEVIRNQFLSYKIIAFRENTTEIECFIKSKLAIYFFDIYDYNENIQKKKLVEINIPLIIEIEKYGSIDVKWVLEQNEYSFII